MANNKRAQLEHQIRVATANLLKLQKQLAALEQAESPVKKPPKPKSPKGKKAKTAPKGYTAEERDFLENIEIPESLKHASKKRQWAYKTSQLSKYKHSRNANSKPQLEPIVKTNIGRYNRLLQMLSPAEANIARRSIENLGIKFTKSGNISMKGISQNKKAIAFFGSDFATQYLKKARERRKAEMQKMLEFSDEMGLTPDEYDAILSELQDRGELWYHADKGGAIYTNTTDLHNVNLKNPKYLKAMGIPYTTDKNGDIILTENTPETDINGYDVTDIIKGN